MADEVEVDLKSALAIRDRRCREPSDGDVERRVPRMIHPGALREPDLPDDLRPAVQCGVGLAPRLERKCGPGVSGGHGSPAETPLSMSSSGAQSTGGSSPVVSRLMWKIDGDTFRELIQSPGPPAAGATAGS